MTDRELLKLAAKAAGIDMVNQPYSDSISIATGGLSWKNWSPLTDDGDALRLALRLDMDLQFYPREIPPFVHAQMFAKSSVREPYGDDKAAATRRAIVRAAAAIGAQQ